MFFRKKKTSISPVPTYREPDHNQHFNPQRPAAIICCVSCKEPLWTIEVRRVQSVVASTKMEPIGKNQRWFDEKRQDCPLCGKDFGNTNEDGSPGFLVRSSLTGESFRI